MSEENIETVVFRDDSLERTEVAKRNREATDAILKRAGIDPSHPEYQRYYALTLSNVNSAGRYGLYNESVENMFVETLQNPDMSIAQYEEATKRYRVTAIETQQRNASGSAFADGRDESYEALIRPYNETLRSGVQMRRELSPTFPKEFYDENGNPVKRLVIELDANSAWNMVNSYADRHQEGGLSFDGENFVVNGKKQSPGAFFNGRANKLEKFVSKVNADSSVIDFSDTELLNLIEKGDINALTELNKTRGMARDKRNKPLLELVKGDPDLLKETAEMLRVAKSENTDLGMMASNLAKKMKENAEFFHKETESGKFHAPKGDIDRIMFSVRPSDVAQQSTFQDWKSCMNAVGCNHHYVDDSIGVGSIVAYGYNSKNPQKKLSRLLIHPYHSSDGTTLYKANGKIYGEDNLAFRDKVNDVVAKKFNDGVKTGFYLRPDNLYNDGDPASLVHVNLSDNIKELDLSPYQGVVVNKGADFSKFEKVTFGKGMILDRVTLPKDVRFGEGVHLYDVTLPEGTAVPDMAVLENVTLPKDVQLGRGVYLENMTVDGATLPKDVRFGGGVQLKNMTLSEGTVVPNVALLDNVMLPKDVRFGKGVRLKNMTLPEGTAVPDKALLDNVTLPKDVKLGEDVQLKNMTLSEGTVVPDGAMLDNVTLSKDVKLGEDVQLKNMTLPEGFVVPDWAMLDNVTLPKDVKLGKFIELKNMTLPEGFVVPDRVRLDNVTLPKDVQLGEGVQLKNMTVDGVTLPKDIQLGEGVHLQNMATEKVTQKMEQKLAPVKEMAAESMDKLEQKLVAKGGTKVATMTAEQIAEQAAKKSGILAQAAAANAKFDKAIDAAIDGSAEVLNNSAVGKVYAEAEKAVSNTKVAKAVGKTVEKAGQAVAKTAVGKAVTKTVAKTAGSAVGKSVLKKIPLVSLGAGAYFAWQRLKDGDWKGACGEVASGALGCLPGLGTAASTAIDVGLAARDISGVVNENGEVVIEQKAKLADARPAKVSAEMKAEIAARGEVKKSVSKMAEQPLTEEKTKTVENVVLLKKGREYSA